MRKILLNEHCDTPDVRRRVPDGKDRSVVLHKYDPRLRVRGHRFDLIPPRGKLPMRDPILMDRDQTPLLHDPADKCKNVNDEKRSREDEKNDLLANIKKQQHRHEKEERQDGDDRRPLQKRRRCPVNANERSQVLSRVDHFDVFFRGFRVSVVSGSKPRKIQNAPKE